jgi:hypothetical protein
MTIIHKPFRKTHTHRERTIRRGVFNFKIKSQPDDTTCGPTCLHAVYRYYGDSISLTQVVNEVKYLKEGGTLAALLACHALNRGYKATLYTYNLSVFDPSWFALTSGRLREKLKAQMAFKKQSKLQASTRAHIDFIDRGGQIRFEDLTPALIRSFLKRNAPIITGLSATYLYHSPREFGPRSDYDDIRGEPAGHFVVLCGYDQNQHTVRVADPLNPNPYIQSPLYDVSLPRLICSILLGVLTYDGKLLIIEPDKKTRNRYFKK